MRAVVYHGPGHKSWEEVPKPELIDDTDAVVRVDAVTICGTDLHILKGDVPAVTPGRILGHEAVGTIEAVGSGVKTRRAGDRVLVSCITACGACRFCREAAYGQCLGGGGWILGHRIDGTQAEYVRVPFADTSTYLQPDGVSDEQLLMLADILPTGYEVGVLNGRVRPGDVVAVVGAGPIGLSVMMGARLYSPSHIVAIDLADSRLDAAKQFGADIVVNNGHEDALAVVRDLTGGLGADVAVEAVGVPATFELAAALARPVATSPTSACTASRPRCTSRSCGSGTSRSGPDWSTPTPRRRCCAWPRATNSTSTASSPTTSTSTSSTRRTTCSAARARLGHSRSCSPAADRPASGTADHTGGGGAMRPVRIVMIVIGAMRRRRSASGW